MLIDSSLAFPIVPLLNYPIPRESLRRGLFQGSDPLHSCTYFCGFKAVCLLKSYYREISEVIPSSMVPASNISLYCVEIRCKCRWSIEYMGVMWKCRCMPAMFTWSMMMLLQSVKTRFRQAGESSQQLSQQVNNGSEVECGVSRTAGKRRCITNVVGDLPLYHRSPHVIDDSV